ncbi:MAG: hypothetical protein Q7U04_05315 [Bacteriovorax sp.]|nr:hypothetical protein [Bacteriovorax sp.]
MIKAFLLMTLALSFSAHANCIGEAQINGKIKEVTKTLSSCRAFLTEDSMIQTSGICPLNEGKLASEGIEVGLVSGHDCKMEAGESISGVLVDNGYIITLEK